MEKKISVIIPVYNEERTIGKVIAHIAKLDEVGQIIVVDDGSADKTKEILRDRLPDSVEVVRSEKNRGKGWAVRQALPRVKYDIIVIQDADLESNPSEYKSLLEPILTGRANVVYGNRLSAAHFMRHPVHFIANKILTSLLNILNGSHISDVCTSLRIFKRHTIQSLNLRSDGFDFDIELTTKTIRSGEEICSLPIFYQPRSRQDGKKFGCIDRLKIIRAVFHNAFYGENKR